MRSAESTDSVTAPPSVCHGSRSPNPPRSLININSGMRYSCAPDTMPLIDARNPWFCISMADFTPARCAPMEMPTPSSSFASRTSVTSGSSSARRIKWTSQVSGNADMIRTPLAFKASKTSWE
jgi:hypothetical protein